jgi:hypothetical protein
MSVNGDECHFFVVSLFYFAECHNAYHCYTECHGDCQYESLIISQLLLLVTVFHEV